jgi:hypothetical protein
MAEVFISYSSADSVKAKDIVDRIEGAGITCWISQRDIPPGADYAIEIPKAITACSYFVLLLTNAAQESPYVMLELDQAFKQKKEIIPILLEQVVENEKTNFFLNAKQKLDATKSITAAVNNVLRRIRPNSSPLENANDQLAQTIDKPKEIVRCPHCGCPVVKRKRLFLDRYLYPEEGVLEEENMAMLLVKNRNMIEPILMLISMIGMFCSFILLITCKDKGLLQIICIVLIGLMNGAIAVVIGNKKTCDVIGELIWAVEDSGLKYWTFRCAKCEKYFSILLPKDKKLKDLIPGLLEDKKN